MLIPEMCPISRRRKLPRLEGIPVSQRRSALLSFWELFVLFGSCRVGTCNVESGLDREGIFSVSSPGLGNAVVLGIFTSDRVPLPLSHLKTPLYYTRFKLKEIPKRKIHM